SFTPRMFNRRFNEISGGLMPRYVSSHTLACMTRQGAEQLTARLTAPNPIMARRVQVNLVDGKMLVEFEAATREALEEWLAGQGVHYDWLMRIELELQQGKLLPAP